MSHYASPTVSLVSQHGSSADDTTSPATSLQSDITEPSMTSPALHQAALSKQAAAQPQPAPQQQQQQPASPPSKQQPQSQQQYPTLHSPHQRDKGIICLRFMKDGSCPVINCPYTHVSATTEHRVPSTRCQYYLKSRCLRDNCSFFHGQQPDLDALRRDRRHMYKPAEYQPSRDPLRPLSAGEASFRAADLPAGEVDGNNLPASGPTLPLAPAPPPMAMPMPPMPPGGMPPGGMPPPHGAPQAFGMPPMPPGVPPLMPGTVPAPYAALPYSGGMPQQHAWPAAPPLMPMAAMPLPAAVPPSGLAGPAYPPTAQQFPPGMPYPPMAAPVHAAPGATAGAPPLWPMPPMPGASTAPPMMAPR